MITLTHTGMRVPTDRICVTNLQEIAIGSGVAWSAVLRRGRTKLGTIFDDGRGGQTQFHPETDQTRHIVDDFVSQCRNHADEPMSQEAVVNALADEYETTLEVTEAERRNAYYVRYADRHDIPGRMTFTLQHSAPPNYEPGLEAGVYLDLPEEAVRAELWMGARGWVEFYRTNDTTE